MNNQKKLLASILLLIPTVIYAQNGNLVGDDVVAISYPDDLNAGSWDCNYANNLAVQFQAENLPFVASDISLYINGSPAPEEWVQENWPTITLMHGLNPGYNTVALTATSPNGQTIIRQKQIIVGGNLPATSGDSVYIDCDATNVALSDTPIPPQEDSNTPLFLNYAVQPWYPPTTYYGGGYEYATPYYHHPYYNSNPRNNTGDNGWNLGSGRGGVPPPVYHGPSTSTNLGSHFNMNTDPHENKVPVQQTYQEYHSPVETRSASPVVEHPVQSTPVIRTNQPLPAHQLSTNSQNQEKH